MEGQQVKSNKNQFYRIFGIILIFVFVFGMLGKDNQTVEAIQANELFGGANTLDSRKTIADEVPNQPQDLNETQELVELAPWRNLRPTESYLREVSMLKNPDDVDCTSPGKKSKGWIVGDAGLILGYCNGVWDHALTTESIPTTLYGISAITPTLAFAVGEGGTILKYGWDDVTKNYVWVKLPIVVSNQILYGLIILEEDHGNYSAWAVGEKDAILNRGTLIHGSITKTASLDPNGYPIYTSSWTNVTAKHSSLPNTNYYFSLYALGKNDIWAVGGNSSTTAGSAIHWNGTSWTYHEVGNSPLYGVYFVSPNDGWAAGEGGFIYHYNGSKWSLHSQPNNNVIVDISFDSKGIGWAVGFDGTILKYNKSLNQWAVFDDLRTDHFDFYSIDQSSGHGWLVGMNLTKGIGGQILEYSEDLWLAVTPPTDNLLNEISVLSDNNAWAVGTADKYGATIIHWDGKHWQRWYQKDSPLPKIDLQTVKMISENNGWAAGDPPAAGAAAVFLHWDGFRWSLPRNLAPLNVRTNDLDMVTLKDPFGNPYDFGWAVANNGNAVAYYDDSDENWKAVHTLDGIYYNLRGTDIVSDGGSERDAWAVGRQLSGNEYFMRFMEVPSVGNTWARYDSPDADASGAGDGPLRTNLFSIEMRGFDPTLDGFAVGDYNGRAVLHRFIEGDWKSIFCQPNGDTNPSRFYSVDVMESTGTAWVGGYYTSGKKVAYLGYYDEDGWGWANDPYPISGKNIYHRPISSVGFSSDTMGWAVGGDKEDPNKISVIYQYPFPNFSLEITPQVRAIRPGAMANYIASALSSGAIDATIELEISGLDPSINSSLSLNIIDINQSSTLALSTTTSTPLGDYFGWLKGSYNFMAGDRPITLSRYEYFELIVTDHPIYSVVPNHGPAGTNVIISGENFGPDPGIGNRDTNENHVILAGKRMPDNSIQSWTDNTITLIVPDDPSIFEHGPEEGLVSVTIEGSPSNQNLSFQLENLITDVSLKENATGYEITVIGTSFGIDPGYLNRSTSNENIYFNGLQIDTGSVTHWDNNKIIFNTNTINLQNFVTVTSNGYKSNVYFFGETVQNVYLPLIIK